MQVTQKQLIVLLREGRVPHQARAAAARAALPLKPGPLLESLDILADDPDATIRAAARASLEGLPDALLLEVAASTSNAGLLDRLARRFGERGAVARAIAANGVAADATVAFLGVLRSGPAAPPVGAALAEAAEAEFQPDLVEEEEPGGEREAPDAAGGVLSARQISIHALLKDMSMGKKVALAVKGNRDVRNILIRDTNKMLCLKVLENPRISETDVETYAKSTNVAEEVLRGIALRKEWCKKYPVVRALVMNPKAPLGMTLDFIKRLTLKDLEHLTKNRNVPETLRSTARKMVELKRQAKP